MAEKKGVILIRFPDELADKLRRVSFEANVPIKDIVSEIVEKNLHVWYGEHFIQVQNEMYDKIPKENWVSEDPVLVEAREILQKSRERYHKCAKLVSKGVIPMEILFDVEPRVLLNMLKNNNMEGIVAAIKKFDQAIEQATPQA